MKMRKITYFTLINLIFFSLSCEEVLDSLKKIELTEKDLLRYNNQVPLYSNLIEYNNLQKAKKEIIESQKENIQERKQEKKSPKLFKKISFCAPNTNLYDLLYLVCKLIDFDCTIDNGVSNQNISQVSFEDRRAIDIFDEIENKIFPGINISFKNDSINVKNVNSSCVSDERFEVEYIDIKYSIIDESFESSIKDIWLHITKEYSNNDNVFLNINKKARILIFSGPREKNQLFKEILKRVDKKILKVKIDAIIVLAQKAFNFDVGINWSGVYNKQNCINRTNCQNFDFVGAGGRLTDFPTPTKSEFPNNENLLVNPLNFALNLFNRSLLIPSMNKGNKDIDASFIKIPFVFGGPDLNIERLNLVLNAAEHESKVKIISRPSILTNDRDTAHIVIGESLPLNTTIEDVVQTVVRNSSSVHYKDVGIVLKVTPTISADEDIFLDLAIEEADVVSGSTRTNNVGIMENPPVINFIRTYNKVSLKSRQTTVIGGLRGFKKQDSNNFVPILSRIPLIGWLFKAKFDYQEDLERYIFITATLVED